MVTGAIYALDGSGPAGVSIKPPDVDIAAGEQFQLFDSGMDLADLRCAREEILTHSQARNTIRGYGASWRAFVRWCEASGRQSLPASPDTVSLFVTWAVEKRQPPYKLNNTKHICSAIRDRHRREDLANPITALVSGLLSGAARKYDQESDAKEALTPAQLSSAIALLGDSALNVRDRAILLIGFTSGWRSAELAGLDLSDVRFLPEYLQLSQRRSKTDQEGKGRKVRIPRLNDNPLCPVSALQGWIKVRGEEPGPLFLPFRGWNPKPEFHRVYPDLVCHVVKRCLESIGVDPDRYGGHSLRVGMITAATENGADAIAIMQRSGHKRIETLVGYVRSAGGFRRDPLAGVLDKKKG